MPLGKGTEALLLGLHSERADGRHALDELQRASLLRRGVDALRQHELDLAGDVVEAEHEPELALPSPRADLLGERNRARAVPSR